MEKFMSQDFLLSTPTARWLYHEIAEKMPIIAILTRRISPRTADSGIFPRSGLEGIIINGDR